MGKKQWGNSVYIHLLQLKEASLYILLRHQSAQTYFLPITMSEELVFTWTLKTESLPFPSLQSLPLNGPIFPLLCLSLTLKAHQALKGLSLPLILKHSLQDALAEYEVQAKMRSWLPGIEWEALLPSAQYPTWNHRQGWNAWQSQWPNEPLGASRGTSVPPPPPHAFLCSKTRCNYLTFFSFFSSPLPPFSWSRRRIYSTCGSYTYSSPEKHHLLFRWK